MRQQLLGLRLKPRYAYGEWVRHSGVSEAQNRLALWLVHGGSLWIDSTEAAGKTHLFHALGQEHRHVGLIAVSNDASGPAMIVMRQWLVHLQNKAWWMVDVPAGGLDAVVGVALFHLIERAREMHRPLAIAWRCATDELAPPELASRLRAMQRQGMVPPQSDAELGAVMRSIAASRQWHIGEGVVDMLLTHLPRSLSLLIEVLDFLEARSLAERKRMHAGWVRSQLPLLKQRFGSHASANEKGGP